MPRALRIAIIGGGLGGMAACLAFHRRGIEATVHERSPELGEIGAGLNLSPNALKALRALGVEDEAIAIAARPPDQVIRSWRSGRVRAPRLRAHPRAARHTRPARLAPPRQGEPPCLTAGALPARSRDGMAQPLRRRQVADPGRMALRLRRRGGDRVLGGDWRVGP
jgi:hypothetical protein